ncbi:MAG TPA: lipopolysaccharide assembly protein LapA domain-containing protein [Eoetvoesiella sp.]
MRYLVWVLRFLVFILVLLFALKNTDPVDVNFYADHVVKSVPLIVVMLVVFVLGVVFGLLVTAPAIMRRRREVKKLKRDLARLQDSINHPVVATEAVVPETIAPLAPL